MKELDEQRNSGKRTGGLDGRKFWTLFIQTLFQNGAATILTFHFISSTKINPTTRKIMSGNTAKF